MKVIGAGLPRTATTTQLFALEQLGFGPCYHMRDLLMNLEGGLPPWEAVAAGNPDWDAIFGDAQATVDFPSARFYPTLMERYPDAKVLLSVRSADGWVKSMRETIWGVYYGDTVLRHLSDARAVIDPLWRRYIELMTTMTWDPETGAMAGDTQDDAEFGRIMERWNESVKQTVPADRLLVWDPADGWGPLCEFLEVPVPDGDLPRLNDTESFKAGIIGGSLGLLNAWWEQQEKPATGLHGAPMQPAQS
jgi:Sulfotransferase domain